MCEQERRAAEVAKAEQARLQEQREADERSHYQQELAQLDEQVARLTFWEWIRGFM